MKRSSFVKSLIGLPAIGLLNIEAVKQYEKVYLKQFFVRGFSYYDGPEIIDEINKSGQLELVREPKNKFDKRAIALHFNKQKIGYLPRESNKTISILMDTDLLEFHAEITHIEPDASDWEKIRVAVFALKEIKSSADLKKIEPFSELYTPNYYSLKSEDNTLTRIELLPPTSDFSEDDQEEDLDDLYALEDLELDDLDELDDFDEASDPDDTESSTDPMDDGFTTVEVDIKFIKEKINEASEFDGVEWLEGKVFGGNVKSKT